MPLSSWLILLGGILLLIGIRLALHANRNAVTVMGEARKGVAVLGDEPGSADMQGKERLLQRSDRDFFWGLWITSFGVVLQTIGSLVSATP